MTHFFSDFNPIASDRNYVEDFQKLNYKKRIFISVLTALGALASLPLFGILGIFTFRKLTKKMIGKNPTKTITLVKTKQVFNHKMGITVPPKDSPSHSLSEKDLLSNYETQSISQIPNLNNIYSSKNPLNYHNFLAEIAKKINISHSFLKEKLDAYIEKSHVEIYNVFLEIVSDITAYEDFLHFLRQQLACLTNDSPSNHQFNFIKLKQFHEVLFFIVNDLINDKQLLNPLKIKFTVLSFTSSCKDGLYSPPDILLRETYDDREDSAKTLKIYHGFCYLENDPEQIFYLPPFMTS